MERLKLAFETDTPYPEYGGGRYDIGYRLGKAMAGYEMWFKRQPPKQNCPDEEWLARLETAIYAESPFLTEGEEATMKAEYFKNFGKSITDFESSIVHISFARVVQDSNNTQTSVIRTPTGAIALYQPYAGYNLIVSINPYSIELGLSWDEWLYFTNVIYKYIGGWGEADCELSKGEFAPYSYWRLRLFFANTDAEMSRDIVSYDKCPLDWEGLIEFMGGMETKIKQNGVQRQPKKQK
ncbi:MAG: hypothetical protein LBH93_05060 [Chitinispirillales bacterium]|nr:hypothetical protein [Chitinispirillales bacterium]